MPTVTRKLVGILKDIAIELAGRNHDRFVAALPSLLEPPAPGRGGPIVRFRRTCARYYRRWGFAYYYRHRDKRAMDLFGTIEHAIEVWSARPETDVAMLCELLEFHFLLCWGFTGSSTEQCRLATRGMSAGARALARDAKPSPPPPAPGEIVHVAWLAMFASPADPMTVGLRHVVSALRLFPDRFRLSVIAWHFPDAAFVQWLREEGATCHVVEASTAVGRVAAIEAIFAADPAALVVSDVNNAVPTALFARRLAPAQLFLQAGMPAWPVRPLHAVFNSFGFDPRIAGWGDARILTFQAPWDLAKLNPPEKPDEMAAQRALMPKSQRLIGNYGRFVKLTRPCLAAVEQILLRCPDAAFVTGGAGDTEAIRAFIAASPVRERMHVVEAFVPGHSWGRLLDVFLDTWPVTGGESSRETIAKGRPVVTMHSDEMPAIDLQRDPALVAPTWAAFVNIVVSLLSNPEAYDAACQRARQFAARMADGKLFASRLADDLDLVLNDVRAGQPAHAMEEAT